MTPYEYSFTRETRPGDDRHARFRGRCRCGRKTHNVYSTPAAALTAIRRTHNPNIEEEKHRD